jgi:hypothetical protein
MALTCRYNTAYGLDKLPCRFTYYFPEFIPHMRFVAVRSRSDEASYFFVTLFIQSAIACSIQCCILNLVAFIYNEFTGNCSLRSTTENKNGLNFQKSQISHFGKGCRLMEKTKGNILHFPPDISQILFFWARR